MTIPVSSMEAPSTSSTLHISTACNTTLYPKTCLATLLPLAASAESADQKDLFRHSLKVSIDDAGAARGLSLELRRNAGGKRPTAIDDCAELLDVSFCQLCDVRDHDRSRSAEDVRTWLSAALTNQQTCIDGLADLLSENAELGARSGNVSEHISNSLALFLHAGGTDDVVGGVGGGRKLLEFGGYSRSLFPAWTTAAERKLLGASPEEMGDRIVVAKDGSGAYSTIAAAVEAAKKKKSGGGRVVIYVKAGVYKENVKIHAGQKNVMLVGDGRGKTVITSDRSFADGWTTFQSATFGEHQTDLAFRFYPC